MEEDPGAIIAVSICGGGFGLIALILCVKQIRSYRREAAIAPVVKPRPPPLHNSESESDDESTTTADDGEAHSPAAASTAQQQEEEEDEYYSSSEITTEEEQQELKQEPPRPQPQFHRSAPNLFAHGAHCNPPPLGTRLNPAPSPNPKPRQQTPAQPPAGDAAFRLEVDLNGPPPNLARARSSKPLPPLFNPPPLVSPRGGSARFQLSQNPRDAAGAPSAGMNTSDPQGGFL